MRKLPAGIGVGGMLVHHGRSDGRDARSRNGSHNCIPDHAAKIIGGALPLSVGSPVFRSGRRSRPSADFQEFGWAAKGHLSNWGSVNSG